LAVRPGRNRVFTQPIGVRVNEMIAGVRSVLGVKLFGDDLDRMRETAREIESILERTAGAADISVEQITGLPILRARVDRAAIARRGMPARDALRTRDALDGLDVGQLVDGVRRVPIAARIHAARRTAPARHGRSLAT